MYSSRYMHDNAKFCCFFRTAVNESFKLNLLANIIWIYRLWCKSFTLILITCVYLFLYASIFPCAHTSVRLLFFMCTNWNPFWLMWLMFSIDKWKSHRYTNGVSEGEKERNCAWTFHYICSANHSCCFFRSPNDFLKCTDQYWML